MRQLSEVICKVKNKNDLSRFGDDTSYVELSLSEPDYEVIGSLLAKDNSNYYTDDGGYVYVDYNTFKEGQEFINDLILKIDSDFSLLEKARYLYIQLGKIMGIDINACEEKNEDYRYLDYNILDNIWGSICYRKANNCSLAKLYMYLCSLVGVRCELVGSSRGYINRVYWENNSFCVDLYNDIMYIQGGFETKYFGSYNNDLNLDKKISYIRDNYSNSYLRTLFREFGGLNKDIFRWLLIRSQGIFNIGNICSYELFRIYKYVFDTYLVNSEIKISNLYINSISNEKEHFVLFNYKDRYFSYNYTVHSFVEISIDDIRKNINAKKIGIYQGEEFSINSYEELGEV